MLSLKSKKNLLPFNKGLDVKLLKLIEEHRVLYDPTDPKHMDLDSRETVWKLIAEQMNIPAMEFAAIQCQIHFGDFQEEKHKPGLIENLKEYLPEQYSSSRGAERKILKLYRKHHGLSHLAAKHLYTKTARDLPTYGVTFFLVKEKQKGKMKMVPRLLGINSESILRLDEITKEILQVWPLTHVMTYHAGKNDTFTLNFGDYSEKEYSVKTNDAYRIRDILEGYIDIIRKRLCAPSSVNFTEGGAVAQECVETGRGQEMTMVANSSSKVVEHSFIGPTKIIPFEQGSKASTGTQVMTVQQVIVTNKGSSKQEIVSGEVPLRSDMSRELVKKLNRMNSNAVKLVTLLSEPTEGNIEQARSIIATMEEIMPFIQTGVKETAEKQTSEEARSKLLRQLEELNALIANTSQRAKQNDMDSEEVLEQARQIADLTAQIYFSLDDRSKRNSRLCRMSRQSFIEDERSTKNLRRASFIHAAANAARAGDDAARILTQEYRGAKLSDREVEQQEASAVDKLGKLNAAVALHLNAHSDPKNIDYEAAVNSMNTLKELLPELAADARAISEAKAGDAGKEILDEIFALIDAARAGGLLSDCEDHQRIDGRHYTVAAQNLATMTALRDAVIRSSCLQVLGQAGHNKTQDATIKFADVSGRLVYIFGAGNPRVNADKENEIMELAREVGDATTHLLVNVNSLTEQAASEPGAELLDNAGVECADAARDLLATAQLTSPTLHEPHCRSALTASCENLSGAAMRLAKQWKPIVENPPRPREADQLANGTLELAKALDRLKNAYANLDDPQQPEISPEQAKKLRFIASVNTSRAALHDARQHLDQPIKPTSLSDSEMNDLQDSIAQKLAQNNAAVASLLQAKSAVSQNHDLDTADLAVRTISEVIPEIIKDARAVLSACPDERARLAMLADFREYCQRADNVCASAAAEDPKELEEATKTFAKSSKKLSFAFSPHARKAREQLMLELFSSAHKQAMQMVDDTDKMADAVGGANADKLRDLGRSVRDSARTLHNTVMVTSPSLDSARCKSALISSSTRLSEAAQRLTSEAAELQDSETGCRVLSAQLQQQQAQLARQADELQSALQAIKQTLEEPCLPTEVVESPKQKVRRLQFIASASAAQQRAREIQQMIEKPSVRANLNEEQIKQLEIKRAVDLAAVNTAIAALINSKTDRNNPNYGDAEEAFQTVSELMPGIINATNKLSSECDGETHALATQDIRAWCDAIQAVCANAAHHDLQEFVDSAQHFANTSDKLKFTFNPHKVSPKKQKLWSLKRQLKRRDPDKSFVFYHKTMAMDPVNQLKQVMQLSQSACGTAKEMVLECEAKAFELSAALAADMCVRARALGDAASALHTTAQLTASDIEVPQNQRALLCSAQRVGETAGQLVSHALEQANPRSKQLGARLVEKKQLLDGALDGINTVCEVGDDGVESGSKAHRLEFIANVSAVNNKLGEIDHLLHQPTGGVKLSAAQAEDLREKLAQDAARVNAAVATLLHALSDVNHRDYSQAEESIESIAELLPAVAKDTKALSAACEGEAARGMIQDVHAWSDALRAVVGAATRHDPQALVDSAQHFANTSDKLKFTFNPHKVSPKEQQVMHLSQSACTTASQMASESEATAAELPAAVADDLRVRGGVLAVAASALNTTARLTAPSIDRPSDSTALVKSAQRVGETAGQLVSHALEQANPRSKQLAVRLVEKKQLLDGALHGINTECDATADKSETETAQRLKFVAGAAVVNNKLDEADYLLDQPTGGVKLSAAQAEDLREKLAQDAARVNAAVATLLHALSDVNHRDYSQAEESIESIAELLPAVAKDTKALSAACEGEAARGMIQDVHAWSDALRAVVGAATRHDPQALVDSAQHFANTSDKLKFTFNPHKVSPKEQQVMHLSQSACTTASQMASESEATAAELPAAVADDLRVRGGVLAVAASALNTTARLTAPSIDRPSDSTALVKSAQRVGETAGQLVSHALEQANPRSKQLAVRLVEKKQLLDGALHGINTECDATADKSETETAQRLKFVAGAAVVNNKLDEADYLLDQPTGGVKLSAAQAEDLREKLAQDAARVNAAVATLLHAHSHVEEVGIKVCYSEAEQSIASIAELVPAVAKETKALSTACTDERARARVLHDAHAWCDAVRAAVGAATRHQHDTKAFNEAVQNLASACGKMKFIHSCRRNTAKENEVLLAAKEVSEHALQMAAEADRISSSFATPVSLATPVTPDTPVTPGNPGACSTHSKGLQSRALALDHAAQTLMSTAKLTASSIHEPTSQAALASSMDSVKAASQELVAFALQAEPSALKLFGAEMQAQDRQLDNKLQYLKAVSSNKNILPETLKKQQLKFVTSANDAEKKAKEVEKLIDQPVSEVQLTEQGSRDLQEKMSQALAQVNAALAAVVNAKCDQRQTNFAAADAEKSFSTISELLPEIVNGTKQLSASCGDDASGKAMVEDIRAWCSAVRAVCASAARQGHKEFNDATLQLCNASRKLRFVNSARKHPVKEQQDKQRIFALQLSVALHDIGFNLTQIATQTGLAIIQLSSSACDKARLMGDETRRVASAVNGAEAAILVNRADTLSAAAAALHTTAQLTAPTIHEPQCQAALLSSADALSSSAQVLVRDTARAKHPEARRLSEEVDRYRGIMERALASLKTAIVTEDTRARGPPPPLPVKRSSLTRHTSGTSRTSGGASRASETSMPQPCVVSHSDARRASEEWLRHMREDATKDIEASLPHGGLTKHDIAELNKKANEEKLLQEKLDKTVEETERTIQQAQQDFNKVTKAPGVTLDADQEEALRRQLELKLALTNKAAAALVASTHPDTVCYTTATEATEKIAEFIPDIVKDAALLSNAGDEKFKNRLLDHIRALCEASNRLVRARTNHQELNEAAMEFGDRSASLLYVVTIETDVAQEKGVIERARGIGDISSALAEGAAGVAGSAGAPHMLRICDAGRDAADAARAFVYTAKLVAPTVHHQQCSNSLITAAHELSTQMKHFSSTWKPLASEAKFSKPVAEMTAEADNLERLLDEFRQDLAAGKLVKRREVEKIIVEDTALRRLTSQIMELAQMHAESGNMADDKKKLFTSYASSLKNAIRALDVANSRCKRDPKDLSKHQDLEDAVQNLQINLLSSRPCAGDHIKNDVVDLTDFVKDSSKKAEKLIEVANKVKIGKENKDEVESIKAECHKINLTAFRLLSPDGRQDGDETSLDGYLDIDQFGQDCETHVQNMKSSIDAIQEKELKEALSKSSLALNESCQYLRFATKSALATAQSASLNETLHALVDLETRLDKMLVSWETTTPATKVSDDAGLLKARSRVIRAAAEISRDAAPQVPAAVSAYVCEIRARTDLNDTHERNRAKDHINRVLELVKQLTAVASTQVATWQPIACPQVAMIVQQLVKELESAVVTDGGEKSSVAALKEVDINRLLMPADVIIEGEPKKIEERLQNTASKLVMLTDTLSQSALRPESLARTAPAITEAALQLAAAARSIPAQSSGQAKRKEEAAQEMCWATYNLLKVGEAVTRSNRGDARIRLRSATGSLTDAINKLARLSCVGDKLNAECSEQTRALQAALGRSQPAPCAAPPIQHCVQALSGQRELLEKLNSDEPMSRVEFSKSLSYVTAAVCNSTEFAAQSAYLITLSEKNRELASEGLVDVPRLQKLTAAMQESCYLIMRSNHVEIAKEEESKLSRLNADLQNAVKEANARTKDGATKRELTEHAFKVDHATKTLGDAVTGSDTCMEKITTHTLTLVDCVGGLNATLDRPGLIPVVGEVSAETRAMTDDIIQHSKALINKTQALIKEVKNADDEEDPMTWVTYNTQRKSVMGAFEALLRSVRQNGERAGLVEVEKEAEEEPEVQQKSFIQIQEEIARKWLQRRSSNVQTAGEAAARDIIDVAENMTEAMKDPEKGEILNVISESRQLVTECSNKYDNDKASLLREHLRELRRAVQRGVVTCLVEDYLHDEPLQDLELFIDAEQDETKRKFLLEKKLAELMSQLGRTTRTARLVARAGVPTPELDKCREQTELLAPRLVAAAQARVSRPDDARATDAYRALLAEYAASLARVQHLCDQAVDPLDFVQTAGETMARMREETTQHGDPMTCAYTSKAITRLASRVISVSMSSTVARADPELRAALTEAQDKLTATVPAPGTRESRLPDWKDTTAEILRTTGEVESALGGENIFKKLPEPDQPIYNAALSLHSAVRGWSARDNEIVGVAKRMAVLMARLSDQMNTARRKESVTRKPWIDLELKTVDKQAEDRKRELIVTSKNIVKESNEVAALAKKLANECSDVRIKMNLLQVCERIPTISGQLKMLTVVKGSTLGNQGGEEDREAMNMLVTNAQNLMSSVQEVVKAAASASVKIASQRGLKWVRKNY